jgi:hypothetical protein
MAASNPLIVLPFLFLNNNKKKIKAERRALKDSRRAMCFPVVVRPASAPSIGNAAGRPA